MEDKSSTLWKNFPCVKVPSKRLFQMAQSVNNIHKLFKVDELKKELLKLLFGTQIELKFPEEGVSPIIESTP